MIELLAILPYIKNRRGYTPAARGRGRVVGAICLMSLGIITLGIADVHAGAIGADWDNRVEFVNDQLDSSRPLLNAYEGLGLYARKISGSDFSAYADVGFSNRWGFEDRKPLEVNHLYFEYEQDNGPISVRAGRHRMFEIVKPVYVDGASVKGRLGKNVELLGFGGMKVPSRHSNIYVSTSTDSMIVDLGLRGDASFALTHFGAAYQQEIIAGDMTTGLQVVSGNIDQQLGSIGSIFGLYSWNISGGSVYEYQVGTRLSPISALMLDLEFKADFAQPDTTGAFAEKVFSDYREASFRTLYSITSAVSASGGYFIRFVDGYDDPAHSATCRLDLLKKYAAGYTHEWGLGGVSWKIDGGAELFNKSLFRSGIGGFFQNTDLTGDNRDAYATWAGDIFAALEPPTSWWGIKLTFQAAGNKYYDYDMRAFVETTIRYSRFMK